MTSEFFNDFPFHPITYLDESLEDKVKRYELKVDEILHNKAKEKGYSDIVSACSYTGTVNPFQAESIRFLNWRAAVWTKCYEILNDVKNVIRDLPTMDEFVSELPTFSEED